MTGGDRTRVQSVTTAGISTETNAYDIEGRVSQYTMTLNARPGNPLVMNYVYDSVNRLTEVFYPEQYGVPGSTRKRIEPQYDNASRLTQMKVAEQVHLSGIVYNPMSQVTELITGAYTGNADIEQYTYDAQTGLLTNQIVKKQNTNVELLNLSYNYNRGSSKGSLNGKTGQLTNIVNNIDRNKDRVYEFDTLGRLTTAKGGIAAGGTGVANWTQNYSFDRYGNRTNVSKTGVTANNQVVPLDGLPNMTYNDTSNRITNSNYEYDLAGAQTRGQAPDGTVQRFEYDAAGRVVVVKADNGTVLETYTYGASRQRLTTTSGSLTTYYAWGGSSVLCEYTENNGGPFTFSKSYVYAGSRLLSTQKWNGSTETNEFHHPDRLGTKLVTNNAADTFYEQSTLPFGTNLDAEFIGNPTTNQRFTSYDRSAGTGLDYAVNRNYTSGQGRFTTVDPIGMASTSLGSPQSLNLFAYAGNNPIDFVDPSGLDNDDNRFSVNPDFDRWLWDRGYDPWDPKQRGSVDWATLEGEWLSERLDEDFFIWLLKIRADAFARAKELLNDEDCANFIREIIQMTSLSMASAIGPAGLTPSLTGNLRELDGETVPFPADYALNEYQRAATELRISRSGVSGRDGNTITYGTTTNFSTISWNTEFYALNVNEAALHIIHESLHLLANFSDQALANSASRIATRNRNNPSGTDYTGTTPSQYLNEQIERNCN